MSILKVITYPHPSLRQKALDVTSFGKKLAHFIDDMIDTMRVSKGVGLAAPQVDSLQRIFVSEYNGELIEMVNPEIIEEFGSCIGEEGCLSLPGVHMMVERAETITVTSQDRSGKSTTKIVDGFMARIIQHEMDHLSGTLIIDRSKVPAE